MSVSQDRMLQLLLDKDQARAVETLRQHGRIFIEAAPGTGKTFLGLCFAVLAYEQGWTGSRNQTLFLTFSKGARIQIENELTRFRDNKWLSSEIASSISVFNYHAFFLEHVSKRCGLWGCGVKPVICSTTERNAMFLDASSKTSSAKRKSKARQLSYALALCRFTAEEILGQANKASDSESERARQRIIKAIRSGIFYYDDLGPLFLNLMEWSSQFVKWLQARYPFVIVDEFQDTDICQWKILQKWNPERIAILCDRYQMIYEWRGASQDRPDDAISTFSIPRDCCVELQEIHRVGEQERLARFILELRKDGLRGGSVTLPPVGESIIIVKSKRQDCEEDCEESKDTRPVRARIYNEVANWARRHKGSRGVLTRSNNLASQLHKSLIKYNIPCVLVTGDSPTAEDRLMEIVADFRLKMQSADVCDYRLLLGMLLDNLVFIKTNTPSENFFAEELDAGGASLLGRHREDLCLVRDIISNHFPEKTGVENGIRRAVRCAAAVAERFSLRHTKWKKNRLIIDRDGAGVLRRVDKRLSAIDEHVSDADVAEKINGILISLSHARLRNPYRGTTVTNMHQAKGREFDHVLIPWLSETPEGYDSRPLNPNCHADRRLLYVAFSRAKKTVTLIYPEESPSPFLTSWKLLDEYIS